LIALLPSEGVWDRQIENPCLQPCQAAEKQLE
jgi:hypothetical protein